MKLIQSTNTEGIHVNLLTAMTVHAHEFYHH